LASTPAAGKNTGETPGRLDIDEHLHDSHCLICGDETSQGLCIGCHIGPQETVAKLSTQLKINEIHLSNTHRICRTCIGSKPGEPIDCESLDCPWLYSRKRAEAKREALASIGELLGDLELDSDWEDTPGEDSSDVDEDVVYQTPQRKRPLSTI